MLHSAVKSGIEAIQVLFFYQGSQVFLRAYVHHIHIIGESL